MSRKQNIPLSLAPKKTPPHATSIEPQESPGKVSRGPLVDLLNAAGKTSSSNKNRMVINAAENIVRYEDRHVVYV